MTAKIIASTNENLKKMSVEKKFRMDLYFRLNTFEITVPPLRAHKEDIPKLVDYFRRRDNLELEFIEGAERMLLRYNWPGNVRELRNVLNQLYYFYPHTIIDEKHVYSATGEMDRLMETGLYPAFEEASTSQREEHPVIRLPETREAAPEESIKSLEQVEQDHIRSVLERYGNNLSQAARVLGIGRSTLYGKMKKISSIRRKNGRAARKTAARP